MQIIIGTACNADDPGGSTAALGAGHTMHTLRAAAFRLAGPTPASACRAARARPDERFHAEHRGRAGSEPGREWPGSGLLTDLTYDFSLYGAVAFVLAFAYWLAWRRELAHAERQTDAPANAVLKRFISVLLASICATILTGSAAS